MTDPLSARTAQVVLVTFFRGEGDMRREVLQVFAEDGELLAEHDGFHVDPVYASYFLRQHATPEMLCIWSGQRVAAGQEVATDACFEWGEPRIFINDIRFPGLTVCREGDACRKPAQEAPMAEIDAQPSALAKEMAAMLADLMLSGGSAMCSPCPELQMLAVSPVQQGALIAALAMRRVLCSAPEGRQALRDLGFEPVLDDVQGE